MGRGLQEVRGDGSRGCCDTQGHLAKQGPAQTLLQEQVGVSTEPQRGQGTHLLCWGWALVSVPWGL